MRREVETLPAMTTALLFVLVPGLVLLALAVDLAALCGWLRTTGTGV